MHDARTTPEIDSRTPLHARRLAAALVAQYVHELSERHAGSHDASTAVASDRPAAEDSDEAAEAYGSTSPRRIA